MKLFWKYFFQGFSHCYNPQSSYSNIHKSALDMVQNDVAMILRDAARAKSKIIEIKKETNGCNG